MRSKFSGIRGVLARGWQRSLQLLCSLQDAPAPLRSRRTPVRSVASGEMITADSVDQTALATTIRRALFADVKVADLDPVMANTMAVASVPLTAEQNELLATCMSQASCDTGHGTLTIGINADAANNPWWNIRRAEATAQAIAYPQVKRIIYTSSPSGDIAEVLANLRSLIAQQVDIIIDNPDFGPAILPVVQQAKDAGIVFVTANAPLPDDTSTSLRYRFPFDLCEMGKTAAAATEQDRRGAVGLCPVHRYPRQRGRGRVASVRPAGPGRARLDQGHRGFHPVDAAGFLAGGERSDRLRSAGRRDPQRRLHGRVLQGVPDREHGSAGDVQRRPPVLLVPGR